MLEHGRCFRGTVSPATLLASCSGIPSPASSSGPLPSEVSSLAPTSPPSPPAPTSPTLNFQQPQLSPICNRELREVLRKINQLPRTTSPPSPSALSSDCHSPGGMLSPIPVTPGTSPGGSKARIISTSRSSQSPWLTHSPVSPHDCHHKRYFTNSYNSGSEDSELYSPFRPLSLRLESTSDPLTISSSASTPNLLNHWPNTLEEEGPFSSSINRTRIHIDECFSRPRVTIEPPSLSPSRTLNPFYPSLTRHSSLGKRWWYQRASIHHL